MEMCRHRRCVIPKLLLLFKIASEHAPVGVTEDDILQLGVRGLVALGVTEEEVIEGTLNLVTAPLMGDGRSHG